MVIVKAFNSARSFKVRGRLGYPWGTGEHIFGFSLLGDENPYSGDYQYRQGRAGRILVKRRIQCPPDPKTARQLDTRLYMANVNKIYKELAPSEIENFKKEEHERSLNTFQVLASNLLKNRPTITGLATFGHSILGDQPQLD
jgi:hypothetical protein